MKVIWRWRYLKPEITLKFDPRDLWIGIYWNLVESVESTYRRLDVYICVVPALPVRLRFEFGWDYKRR